MFALLKVLNISMTGISAKRSFNLIGRTKFGSVGPALPGVEVKIAEEDGEILVRGPNVFLGYFKDPEATGDVRGGERTVGARVARHDLVDRARPGQEEASQFDDLGIEVVTVLKLPTVARYADPGWIPGR